MVSASPPSEPAPGTGSSSQYLRTVALVFRRPSVLLHVIRAAWAFRARGWYRRPPFLPLPPASYLRWRMETAFGDADAHPGDDAMARYFAWGTRMRRDMARRARA